MKILKTSFLCIVLLVLFTHAKAQVGSANAAISHVTDSYETIKKALAANDGAAAAKKAGEFMITLNQVPVKYMKPDQLKVWTKYIDQLQLDARHISEVPRVPHQKEHFAKLTKNLHKVLDAFGMDRI